MQENGNNATVAVNLGGENLPNGFPLQIVMEKREGKWNVISISNFEDYIKTLKAGRNAAALQYVEQEKPFIKKYNETIRALKEKYPVLSTEYVNGYEAAEKELAAGYASLTSPLAAESLISYRKKRFELATEHIRLIRAYLAGDHSAANQEARKQAEKEIDRNAHNIKTTIERYKR